MPSSRLAEHYGTLPRQEHAARLGMWVFLSSELLLFGGLFALYAAYRGMYARDFARAVAHNTLAYGTVNTYVLITSSLTVALGLHEVRHGRSRRAIALVGATVLFGIAFLVIKGFEYADHFAHGIYPGRSYASSELPTHGASLFYTLYYFMTGLHALHVTAGITLLTWVAVGIGRGRLGPERALPVELAGLYWHLVDVVWIFLWPILYLMR